MDESERVTACLSHYAQCLQRDLLTSETSRGTGVAGHFIYCMWTILDGRDEDDKLEEDAVSCNKLLYERKVILLSGQSCCCL